MENCLAQRVDNTLLSMGMPTLKHPIFYNCPIGLRFEISEPWGDNECFNYFKNAFEKVFHIYSDLSADFNILRIDVLLDADDCQGSRLTDKEQDINVICSTTGLPFPMEERECTILYDIGNGETVTLIEVQYYWNLKLISFDIKALLMQIILTDFPSQGGGNPQFESSVFLFATDKYLMFHLYDDRGLGLVSKDKETLYPFYKKYNSWIMDYDRKRIENIFTS
ncbi:DUF3885 domain-containing protein [Tissierella sp.]|uniref:DUF3885 domain-containing protein n=1 Tax=Tissierella sp. TaxID=41274 RepID=UPI0028B01D9F|nr:DUF3885 domain-containing protein [Tissierella sp.]